MSDYPLFFVLTAAVVLASIESCFCSFKAADCRVSAEAIASAVASVQAAPSSGPCRDSVISLYALDSSVQVRCDAGAIAEVDIRAGVVVCACPGPGVAAAGPWEVQP